VRTRVEVFADQPTRALAAYNYVRAE